MSNEENQENRVESHSTSSLLRSQDTESDMETEQGSDAIINLFMSVTNSDTSANHVSVTVRTSKNKSIDPDKDSKKVKHGPEGPHLCSEDSVSLTDTEELNGNTDQEDMDTEESILNVPLSQLLKEEECELREVAAAWLTEYQSSRNEALRSMLELILNASGVLQAITKAQALKLDQLKPEVYDSWLHITESQPLLLEDVFNVNCLKFLELTLADDDCLLDILMMRRIKTLLDVMTHSSWVSVRYSALLIASEITFQYIQYLSQQDSELLLTDNEEDGRRSIGRNLFEDYVEIVILAQRDVALAIRKHAITIYCSWSVKGIHLLMSDKYLRYIFWAMYDDSSSIRRLAVKTCGSLYKYNFVVENLKKFVEKTLSVMVSRVLDDSDGVAAASLDTLSNLYRETPWLLKNIDMEKIMLLVFGDGWRASRASMFLHEMLEDMSTTTTRFIFNTVLFLEESMVKLGENTNVMSAVTVMVENLFPHSQRELADWTAWRHLLLGNSLDEMERLQQLAGYLLVEIISFISERADNRYFVETDFPPTPSLNYKKRIKRCLADEKQKTECSYYLDKLTSKFGPYLITLWEKFKNSPCLTRLIQMPQFFNGSVDSLDMKGIFCYLVYLSKVSFSSLRMEAVHRSLACLYHFALNSPRWKQDIPKLERMLFKDATVRFMKACEILGRKKLRPQVKLGCIKVLKQAFYLSKFFDVTKTCLRDDAMYALRNWVSVRNVEIICTTLMMCLYMIEWQLLNVVNHDLPKDERTSRLHKILSQSRTLMLQLEYLIKIKNSLIRETAFSVMCRLLSTLSPHNTYCASLDLVHLPPPSLEVTEWLNYNLLCQVPPGNIPQDLNKFQMSRKALQMYCSVVEVQAVNTYFFYSVLVYFKFYRSPKNYNSILESNFQVMARREQFPYVLIEMLIWMKLNMEHNVEEITKGICAVGLPKLSTSKLQRFAREVIGYGLSQITNQRYHFVFQIVTHFIRHLNKNDMEMFYYRVEDTFHLYIEKEELKEFLNACVHNMELRTKQANMNSSEISLDSCNDQN